LKKLGIIAALPAEAKCLDQSTLHLVSPVEIQKDIFLCLSGIGYESASNAAKKLLELKIDGLVSWGVAGAIDSSVNSGDLIIADSIISHNKTYLVSTEWKNKLLRHMQKSSNQLLNGNIASSKEICATTKEKENLLQRTGALAVDMESAAIAEVSRDNKLDFLVIRTIADQANASIPEAVLKHTDNLGNPKLLKFILSCITKPMQIRDLAILAKNYNKALKTLDELAADFKKQNFFYD